jgi:ParB family chromosome partitioning protein
VSKDDRRLGKGLAALLGENLGEEASSGDNELAIDRIRPNPYQPRREMGPEALEDLARSIEANGLLQPIVVRPVADGFEIVAGERRFRALQRLGWERAPVITRTFTDEQMLVVALVENLQREDLAILEEAEGYQRLIDEFELTQEEVGRHVGRDRSTVANAIRLLALPDEIKRLLDSGKLSGGHGRALLGVEGDAAQLTLATRAAAEGWSVRETERRVREARTGPESRSTKAPSERVPAAKDPIVRRAELVLERSLGTQVRIRVRPDGGGELTVSFHDAEDFFRLAERIAGDRVADELRG